MDKISGIIDFLISIIGIIGCLFFINKKHKTQPNMNLYGFKIQTINRIGFLAIIIFIVLLIIKLA